MNLGKNAINLIGGVLIGAILLLAVLAGALPMWDQAQSTNDEADRVAAQNAVQRTQIDALAQKQAELPVLQERVSRLQAQMPSVPALESVIRVAYASVGNDVQLQKIEPGAAAPFVPREEPADLSEDAGKQPAAAAPAEGETAAGLQQIPVTIVAGAKTTEAAVAFLDRMREGPRLVGVDSAVIEDRGPEEMPYTVTLVGRVFVVAS